MTKIGSSVSQEYCILFFGSNFLVVVVVVFVIVVISVYWRMTCWDPGLSVATVDNSVFPLLQDAEYCMKRCDSSTEIRRRKGPNEGGFPTFADL